MCKTVMDKWDLIPKVCTVEKQLVQSTCRAVVDKWDLIQSISADYFRHIAGTAGTINLCEPYCTHKMKSIVWINLVYINVVYMM